MRQNPSADYPDWMLANPVSEDFWEAESFHLAITSSSSVSQTKRTTQRIIEELAWLPAAKPIGEVRDERSRPLIGLVSESLVKRAKKKREQAWVLQIQEIDETQSVLVLNDGRLAKRWRFVPNSSLKVEFLSELSLLTGARSAVIWPDGPAVPFCRELVEKFGKHSLDGEGGESMTFAMTAYQAVQSRVSLEQSRKERTASLTHLDRLEAESIFIMREVIAQAENPVMLYSVGKDSAVMLHIARKAFYPSSPPFPLMHVDTRWKFQAMYDFRDYMAAESKMDLIVHVNPEGVEKNINPFDHGSALHTDIIKTQGLKQALDMHKFDVAFGGARRDEEKSRAKERIFSFRNPQHRWDPKNQRPELWSLYNGYKNPGESIRVFPLSNWTELDVWQYINREGIEIVPLYFAAERPVIERDGMLLMVDDDRMRMSEGEEIRTRLVRFRTLGCYPLTGAIDSSATSLPEIVLELLQSKTSERQGRAIDSDSSASMEKKKQEGYF